MNKKASFVLSYIFLETIWNTTEDMGDLDVVISDMDPFLFRGQNSADSACYYDWSKFVGEINSYDNIYHSLIDYLEEFQLNFDFNLKKIIKSLRENKFKDLWSESIHLVQSNMNNPEFKTYFK